MKRSYFSRLTKDRRKRGNNSNSGSRQLLSITTADQEENQSQEEEEEEEDNADYQAALFTSEAFDLLDNAVNVINSLLDNTTQMDLS